MLFKHLFEVQSHLNALVEGLNIFMTLTFAMVQFIRIQVRGYDNRITWVQKQAASEQRECISRYLIFLSTVVDVIFPALAQNALQFL